MNYIFKHPRFSYLLATIAFKLDPLAPEHIRAQKLSRYFSPSLEQKLSLDPFDLDNARRSKNYMQVRGFIKVSPPASTCFIITRHFEKPDIRVCKEKTISFNAEELADNGKLRWQVKTGSGDFGTEITWDSDLRRAQFIKSGEYEPGVSPTIMPVLRCEALGKSKAIHLSLANGIKWRIQFPKDDLFIPQPDPEKNLFIQQGNKKLIGSDEAAEKSTDAKAEAAKTVEAVAEEASQNQPKKAKSGFLTFIKVDKADQDTYAWNIPSKDTYGMNSDHVKIGDGPPGLRGFCRYRYNGAPLDPTSGVIECHNTDSYDSIFAYLTCSQQLKNQ